MRWSRIEEQVKGFPTVFKSLQSDGLFSNYGMGVLWYDYDGIHACSFRRDTIGRRLSDKVIDTLQLKRRMRAFDWHSNHWNWICT